MSRVNRISLAAVFLAAQLITGVSFATDGTWTSTANGTWSNPANWGASTVADGAAGIANFGTIDITSDVTVDQDTAGKTIGQLIFGDANTTTAAGWNLISTGSNGLILDNTGGTGGPTITVNSLGTGKSATIGLVLNGAAGLTKAGTGNLSLTAANLYTGGTVVNRGTLTVDFSAAGAPTTDIIANTGTFNIANNSTFSVVGAAGATNSQTFASSTISAGPSTINVQNGAGGTATLNMGTFTQPAVGAAVRFVGPATQDSAGVPVAATGAINMTGATVTNGILGAYSGASNITFAGAGYGTVGLYDFAGSSAGVVTGLSQVAGGYTATNVITGSVNVDLNANATTASGGSQRASGPIRFNTPAANSIALGSGALFTCPAFLITPNMGANNVTLSMSGAQSNGWQIVRQTNPNGNQQGTIWQNDTAGFFNITAQIINGREGTSDPSNIVKMGAGTMALTGTNSYTGTTYLYEGTTLITVSDSTANSNGSLGNPNTPGAVRLNGGSLVANANVSLVAGRGIGLTGNGALGATTGNTFTVNGVISDQASGAQALTIGSGQIVGTGVGTANTTALFGNGSVALAGANTYTKGTTVANGTLLLTNTAGTSATGTGNVTVASGATIGGTGESSGAVTIQNGGFVAAGVPGVLSGVSTTFKVGSLTLNAGSTANFDLSPGTNDTINISGAAGLTVNPGVNVNLFSAGSASPYNVNGTFTLFKIPTGTIPSAATLQADLTVINPASAFGTYTWGISGTDVTLTIAGLAISSEWAVDASGNWETPTTNWTSTPTVPGSTAGDAVKFGNNAMTVNPTVTLTANKTLGQITFSNTNGKSYTIVGGGGNIIMNNNASPATIADNNGSHTISANMTLQSNTTALVTNPTDTLTISGNISGSKNFSVQGGNSTVVLLGNNSYVDTYVDGGEGITVGNGTTVGTLGTGNVQVNGTLTINHSDPFAIGGAVTGSGTLTNGGTGATTLTNVGGNSGAWGTTVNAGSIVVGAGSALGTGNLTTATGGTLDLNGYSPSSTSLNGSGGNITSATPATITLSQPSFTNYGGNIGGAISLVKNGTQNWALSGTNSFTGSVVNDNGQLQLLSNSAVPAGVTVTSHTPGTGILMGAPTMAANVVLDPSISSAVTLMDVQTGVSVAMTGSISSPAAPTTTGAQYRLAAGNGPATANTFIDVQGNLQFGTSTFTASFLVFERGDWTFSHNSVTQARASNFWLGRNGGSTVNFTVKDTALVQSMGQITMNTGGNVNTTQTNLTIQDNANVIAGDPAGTNATLNPTATPTFANFELNGNTGTTVLNLNGGTLTANQFFKSGAGLATVNLNGGVIKAEQAAAAFLPADNGSATLNYLVQAGGAKINSNGVDIGTSALLADGGGGGGLTKQGAGTLTIGANNTYTGATAVSGGTLAFNVSQTNMAGGITVASGATAGIVAAGDSTGLINAQPALVNGAGDPSGYVPGDKYVIANNVTVAAGGHFDVNDGILVINNGTFSAVNAAVHAGRIFSSTSQYDANNLLGLTGLGMGDNFDLSYAGIGPNNQLTITGSLIPAASDFGQQFIFKYTYIGDANLDGKVTTSDYDFVFGNLGSTTNGVTGNPVIWGDGDFNGNGVVDTTDLDNLFANLGFGTTGNVQPPLLPGTSVPEPSSVALLLLGLAGSAAVIRRKK